MPARMRLERGAFQVLAALDESAREEGGARYRGHGRQGCDGAAPPWPVAHLASPAGLTALDGSTGLAARRPADRAERVELRPAFAAQVLAELCGDGRAHPVEDDEQHPARPAAVAALQRGRDDPVEELLDEQRGPAVGGRAGNARRGGAVRRSTDGGPAGQLPGERLVEVASAARRGLVELAVGRCELRLPVAGPQRCERHVDPGPVGQVGVEPGGQGGRGAGRYAPPARRPAGGRGVRGKPAHHPGRHRGPFDPVAAQLGEPVPAQPADRVDDVGHRAGEGRGDAGVRQAQERAHRRRDSRQPGVEPDGQDVADGTGGPPAEVVEQPLRPVQQSRYLVVRVQGRRRGDGEPERGRADPTGTGPDGVDCGHDETTHRVGERPHGHVIEPGVAEAQVGASLRAFRAVRRGRVPQAVADQAERQRVRAVPGVDQREQCAGDPAGPVDEPAGEAGPLGVRQRAERLRAARCDAPSQQCRRIEVGRPYPELVQAEPAERELTERDVPAEHGAGEARPAAAWPRLQQRLRGPSFGDQLRVHPGGAEVLLDGGPRFDDVDPVPADLAEHPVTERGLVGVGEQDQHVVASTRAAPGDLFEDSQR